MKLNLGCGGRVFGGDWINVDVIEQSPSTAVQYLKADVSQRLPFDDDSADEVFSCHVLEHLWPWDVECILKDWIRVLKPGGAFVVECPNIAGAAALLMAAEYAESADLLTTAMFAFYGDPGYKTIEQRHKWGYTPKTLLALFRSLGLKETRQEPARFKMKEPRDMRIVGVK
jgi:ubiquinone/menaquinone biosynthesis C-methylase UbiE